MTIPVDVARRLEEKRQRVEDARRRLELAEAELRAFEEALRLVAGSDLGTNQRDRPAVREIPADYRKRGRPLKAEWKAVLTKLAEEYPRPCPIPTVERVIRDHGYQGANSSIRAQMADWAKRGVVSRVADGIYTITDKGASIIGLDLPTVTDTQDTLE